MLCSIGVDAAMRVVETDKWAGSAGVPVVSKGHTVYHEPLAWVGGLLVANIPAAAAGHASARLPTTYDKVGWVGSDHVVHAVAGGEAKVNCKRFAHSIGVPRKAEG